MDKVNSLLTLDFLKGWRTRIIGGGMILTGLGGIAAHLAAVIGGEPINWNTIQENGVLIFTGFGLITAAVHKPVK